jgi:hypothetical protein
MVESANKTLSVSTAGGNIKINNVGGEIKATSVEILWLALLKAAKLNTSGGY